MVKLKETNLDGVKAMARTLLFTDIHKTSLSPIVVQHPFTSSGFNIQFEKEPYVVPLRDNKNICYASKDALMRAAYDKYTKDKNNPEDEIPEGSYSVEQVLGEKNYPPSNRSARQHHAAKLSETPNPEETA